jgi:hypothetical protein
VTGGAGIDRLTTGLLGAEGADAEIADVEEGHGREALGGSARLPTS